MDKFEEAICGHNPLYKEGLQDKYYQGAKWAWQSRQAEIDEKNKRIEAISLILDGLKNAKYMHSQNKAYNSILIEKLEKALRGEHE